MVTIKTQQEIIEDSDEHFKNLDVSAGWTEYQELFYSKKWVLVEGLIIRLKSISTGSSDYSHKELKKLIEELKGVMEWL